MGAAVSWLLQQSQNRLSDKRSIVLSCIFAIAGCVGYISSIQWLYPMLQSSISNYRVASNAFVPQTANTGQFQHKAATQLFLHPNSSLKGDVLSIVHHPQEAAISIQFKENASCPHPYLRGRLSGPALVVLGEWTYQNGADGANMLSGIYRAPYPGRYFLEIIAIFCDDFSRNQAHITPHSRTLWENGVDFSRICTQPSSQRQLTSSNTVIDVTKASLEGLEGNWLWNGSIHTPLYTRFQQPGCYKGSNVPECTNSRTSVEPFAGYSWQFMNTSEPLSIQDFDPPQSPTTVCVIGDSHTRKMYEYLVAGGISYVANLSLVYHDARMPFQVTVQVIRKLMITKNCGTFVIAVGQWPASKHFRINRLSPLSFNQFYRSYSHMLSSITKALPDVPVFARSINFNPLGSLIGGCKPTDWRSPLVIDGYNAVIRHVVSEIKSKNLSFIDTNFLIGPVWDSASDWCHLDRYVGILHAIYVLSKVVHGYN